MTSIHDVEEGDLYVAEEDHPSAYEWVFIEAELTDSLGAPLVDVIARRMNGDIWDEQWARDRVRENMEGVRPADREERLAVAGSLTLLAGEILQGGDW